MSSNGGHKTATSKKSGLKNRAKREKDRLPEHPEAERLACSGVQSWFDGELASGLAAAVVTVAVAIAVAWENEKLG